MNTLRACIEKYVQLPDEVFEDISNHFTEVELPSRAYLIKQDKICSHIWFVSKGLVRSYYSKDEKEINCWFVFEGDFATSFYSIFTGKPGYENLQLLEDSIFYQMEFKTFDAFTKKYPQINQLYRQILEEGYLYWEKRIMMLQFEQAKDRYQHILNDHPEVVQRIPLQHLASYLGITQETLSRIRSTR